MYRKSFGIHFHISHVWNKLKIEWNESNNLKWAEHRVSVGVTKHENFFAINFSSDKIQTKLSKFRSSRLLESFKSFFSELPNRPTPTHKQHSMSIYLNSILKLFSIICGKKWNRFTWTYSEDIFHPLNEIKTENSFELSSSLNSSKFES